MSFGHSFKFHYHSLCFFFSYDKSQIKFNDFPILTGSSNFKPVYLKTEGLTHKCYKFNTLSDQYIVRTFWKKRTNQINLLFRGVQCFINDIIRIGNNPKKTSLWSIKCITVTLLHRENKDNNSFHLQSNT